MRASCYKKLARQIAIAVPTQKALGVRSNTST
jgi:hypothetical protein